MDALLCRKRTGQSQAKHYFLSMQLRLLKPMSHCGSIDKGGSGTLSLSCPVITSSLKTVEHNDEDGCMPGLHNKNKKQEMEHTITIKKDGCCLR